MKTLVTIMALLILGSITQAQTMFEFQVMTSKVTYLLGETIDIGMYVKNNAHPSLPENINFEITVKLIDQLGQQLSYNRYHSIDGFTPSFKKLKSEGEWFYIIELNEYFGTPRHLDQESIINLGKYRAELTFTSSISKEQIYVVNFEVVEPTENEKIVFESFSQAYIDLIDQKYDSNSFLEYLESLLADSKTSVYAPQILISLELGYMYRLKDDKKAQETRTTLLQTYPWSSKSFFLIDLVLNEMSSSTERIEFLSKIKSKSQGSPMFRILEKRLFQEINN
jgi:hypothetical protein